MIGVPTLKDAGDLDGARVLVRLGLNVPIVGGEVTEAFRLEVVVPTLEKLKRAGARTLVIAHISSNGDESLRPVHRFLEERVGPIKFVDHLPFDTGVLEKGGLALLENTRRLPGEKENDVDLSRRFAACADIFVNDAFSDSHREHASVSGVAKVMPSYIGPWFETEVRELSQAFDPVRPFEMIIGGAKIETKLPLVRKFLDIADNVFVGGALANDIWESQGYEVGRSIISNEVDLGDVVSHEKLDLPEDVIVERAGAPEQVQPDAVRSSDRIVDIGGASILHLKSRIDPARLIVWNGPLGNTDEGFIHGTEGLAQIVADAPAHAIVGGGDTIAAISKLNLFDRFGFVSTGGGAMLSFLSNETLVAIESIKEYWKAN